MGDLIDRKALLAECAEAQKSDPYFKDRGWANHFINEAGKPSTEWYAVEAMIEDAPAVDAAPVVRCKDCKWWKRFDIEDGIRYGDCTNPRAIIRKDAIPSERYFCPDGERKDGGGAQVDRGWRGKRWAI